MIQTQIRDIRNVKLWAMQIYFWRTHQEGIYRWLRRGTLGELVFDAKPYVCYSAVPSKKITISLYDHETEDGAIRYSGTFTAFFRCYDPFGQLRKISWNDDALPGEQAHTGLLPARMMPAPPTAQTRKLLVYNPGTERAHTRIRLTGSVGSGLLIRNFTTGQRCRVVSLEEDSLLPGAVQELNSRMGQTRIVLGEETTLAFAMHDEGYIELAPCTPFVRALKITHTAGSNEIISEAGFKKYMEGQYLYLDGWKKIRQVAGTDQATCLNLPTEAARRIRPL